MHTCPGTPKLPNVLRSRHAIPAPFHTLLRQRNEKRSEEVRHRYVATGRRDLRIQAPAVYSSHEMTGILDPTDASQRTCVLMRSHLNHTIDCTESLSAPRRTPESIIKSYLQENPESASLTATADSFRVDSSSGGTNSVCKSPATNNVELKLISQT